MTIADSADQLSQLAEDVPTQTAGWIDGELEEVLQTGLGIIGQGHPLRIDLGTAIVARQREALALRASLQALQTEIRGFARGLTG
jgi:hypothetical protein